MSAAIDDYGFVPEPVYIQARNTVVPSFYDKTIHPHGEAVVTQNGLPIELEGERLHISMVPPEYRWAVGPEVEGRCELLPQDKYERLHGLWWAEQLRYLGAPVDALHLRTIHTVRDFVSWKVDRGDPKRLVPLGVPFEGQEKKAPEQLYSPSKDRFYSREELAAEAAKETQGVDSAVLAEAMKAIAEMRAENEHLRGLLEAANEHLGTKAPTTTPCGKEVKQGGIAVHVTNCREDACREAKAVREATKVKRGE